NDEANNPAACRPTHVLSAILRLIPNTLYSSDVPSRRHDPCADVSALPVVRPWARLRAAAIADLSLRRDGPKNGRHVGRTDATSGDIRDRALARSHQCRPK